MSELERVVHIEREGLRDEILRHKHKVSQSEKRLKERTDKHFARNMSRMTREFKQKKQRLKDDMEQLRNPQDQPLETHDSRMNALMERRTEVIMDR